MLTVCTVVATSSAGRQQGGLPGLCPLPVACPINVPGTRLSVDRNKGVCCQEIWEASLLRHSNRLQEGAGQILPCFMSRKPVVTGGQCSAWV